MAHVGSMTHADDIRTLSNNSDNLELHANIPHTKLFTEKWSLPKY